MPRVATDPSVHRSIRALFEVGAATGLSDGALIDRFLDAEPDRSTSALETLVERHATMVHRVCSSVLSDPDAAADAFQATFLVLARRASSIRQAESVGPWLFGVARRVALRSRRDEARRRRFERRAAESRPTVGRDQPEPDGGESAARLFTELDRLPGRYRDPIVLCYLEGLSHEQAAARVGCRLTTFRTRLARGKDRLRDRLTRRGITPAMYAGLLTPPGGAGAPLPADWIARAVAAGASARGPAVAATVVALARAGSPTSLTRIIFPSLILLAGAIGVAGFADWNDGAPPGPEAGEPASEPLAPTPPVAAWITPPFDEPNQQPPQGNLSPFVCPDDGSASRIARILPEGCEVKQGDIVCSLDTAVAAWDQIRHQKSVVSQAEDVALAASVDLDSARSRKEGLEFKLHDRDLQEAKQAIEIAQDELDLAKRELEALKSSPNAEPDSLAIRRTEIEVAKAALNRSRSETVSLRRNVQAQLDIYEADARYLRAKAALAAAEERASIERTNQLRLERDVENGMYRAPFDGSVRHCRPGIEDGAPVKPSEPIVWCVPATTTEQPKTETKH